ncbi:hypothetical protein UF64_04430 [Thalassospira sp. HJ]|uniref:hypothetical protein n=1 Tax=Thalassospira sp. HJ TaxID=1616823 RepID=UPI0005CE346E|nr:hypothetical protein [Thalassospira sp. HJ]KJE36398.1 hypothetical protein UF64_04430 [Thalassospira sp. HJ]
MTNIFDEFVRSLAARCFTVFVLGILLFGGEVKAEPVLLKDGITRTADGVLEEAAANWVNCARELPIPYLQTCRINEPDKVVTFRYGAEGSYFFYVFKSVKPIEITCWNNVLGDPNPGVPKFCDYTTGTVYGGLDGTDYREVAKEGEQFNVDVSARNVWVRFGFVGAAGGQWYYRTVNSKQKLTCNIAEMGQGFDPAPNIKKVCQVGPVVQEIQNAFKKCATEGATCTVTDRPVFVRYGIDDSWTQRLMRTPSSKPFACTNSQFGIDPARLKSKECWFSEYVPAPGATNVYGQWKQKQTCFGNACGSLSATVSRGVSTTDSWEKTDSYGQSITTKIESGELPILGGGKVSAEAGLTFSQTSSWSSASTTEIKNGFEVQCNFGSVSDTSFGEMWQFETISSSQCLDKITCSGSIEVLDYMCIVWKEIPKEMNPPVCLPGYCKNNACTECTYN